MAKNKGGRPTKMTDETVKKLEEGFAMGFTDVEACLYADISAKTLYTYIESHPEFSQRKEELKDKPNMNAKATISRTLDSDTQNAKWWLEHKSKGEFSKHSKTENKTEVTEKIEIDKVMEKELYKEFGNK